jgi:cation diffusion facilitator CzcD-associated flavoprotein CzcO
LRPDLTPEQTYIAPAFSEEMLPRHPDGTLDTRYTEQQIKEFEEDPAALIAHREALEGGISQGFQAFLKHTKIQQTFREAVKGSMRKRLAKKPELAEFLIPDWELGCRRLTPGIGYLEALCEDNVDVVTTGIKAFTPTGLEMEDGEKRDYDAISESPRAAL